MILGQKESKADLTDLIKINLTIEFFLIKINQKKDFR